MTETPDLARHLFDRVTTTGTLTDAEWQLFKTEHHVEARQVEPTLLLTVQHVLTLANALQAEVGRLSVALHRRG